jgi:hypothetical protein
MTPVTTVIAGRQPKIPRLAQRIDDQDNPDLRGRWVLTYMASCESSLDALDLHRSALADPALGLSGTDRVIILHLAQSPTELRVKDLARSTGSGCRGIKNAARKLTDLGDLLRVTPNAFRISPEFGAQS